jgi:putative DNA primase/helicase
MLLNVENGTLDLRTGSLRPHSPEDFIIKLAPVEFDTTAEAPTFERFLKQVLVDKELIRFVQRYPGYSLTGSTKERTMAVLHGVGKNGYGDATAQYQLAELTGVRFVRMSETKREVKLEESVVKQITGNDTISARAPYGRPFTYRPQFKIWMWTNHKPEIPDGSEAIWNRIVLIPFNQRFEGAKADADLPEKLRAELPGVLAWAVMGCVEWWQHGLGSAAAVERRTTSAYRTETEVVERFLDEMCVFGPDLRVTKTEMYETYEQWCMEEGEGPHSPKSFTGLMNEKGVVKNFEGGKSGSSRIWKRVALRSNRPNDGTSEEVSHPQKSCKQMGGETSEGHFSENPETFLRIRLA